MPDLPLRLNKDMLVMSTLFDYALSQQGFTTTEDKVYVALCEPELIEEACKIESIIETPVLVAPTEEMTSLYLAKARFEGRSEEMVQNVYQAMMSVRPEHLIAAVAPSGLPLDESSKVSLRQSRKIYQDAVSILKEYDFDGIFFEGFTNPYDLQCALMGARAVYDGLVLSSYALDEQGQLAYGYDVSEAIGLASEYGSDVVGLRTSFAPEQMEPLITEAKRATSKPFLVEIDVRLGSKGAVGAGAEVCSAFEAQAGGGVSTAVSSSLTARTKPFLRHDTENCPYYSPDTFAEAGLALHSWGVQFVRGVGEVTPAYTATLLATLQGRDVIGA